MTKIINTGPLVGVGAFFIALCVLNVASTLGSVVVDAGYFTGNRTTSGTSGAANGLTWNPAAGSWSNGGFSIAWVITPVSGGYTYKYTVNTPTDGSARLSHWILELSPVDSDGSVLTSYWQDVFVTPPSPGNFTETGIGGIAAGEVGPTGSQNGNPGMPDVNVLGNDADDIWGVRFTPDEEVNTTTVTFTTPQVPVWGDFYAKDGGGTGANAIYAYNAGFGNDPTGNNITNWIPVPDGESTPAPPAVPEPASFAVWALLGAAGLCVAKRYSV